MDVILDSNQYVNNPKMTGIKFQSLFDYLRRTGNSLVIPRVVRDEVLARYEDDLKREYSQTVQFLKGLGKRVFELMVPELPKLDLAKELARLEQKLQNPAPGVSTIVGQDYTDVSLEEVAKRGIRRKKPASAKGEELRDVIVWLAATAHAKRQKREVGLVSSDLDFRGPDSRLHPDLQQESASEDVTLHFAVAVDDFVKAHSPTPKSVTAEWVAEHLETEQVGEVKRIFRLLAQRALGVGNAPLVVLSATEPILQFKRGNLFDVSEGSVYAELEYEGSSVFDVSDAAFYVPPLAYNAPPAAITAGQVSVPYQFEGVMGVTGPLRPCSACDIYSGTEVDGSFYELCGVDSWPIRDKVDVILRESRCVFSRFGKSRDSTGGRPG